MNKIFDLGIKAISSDTLAENYPRNYNNIVEINGLVDALVDYVVQEIYNNTDAEYRCSHCAVNEASCDPALVPQCKLGMRDYILMKVGIIDKNPMEYASEILKQKEN